MYHKFCQMSPLTSLLTDLDWDRVGDVKWFESGFGAVDTDAIEQFRPATQIWLAQPVSVLSLVGIKPGGTIRPHEDGVTAGLSRYHFVVRTNQWCFSFHDDGWQQLEYGGVYLMDANKIHASVNLGDTTRWHLIADVIAAAPETTLRKHEASAHAVPEIQVGDVVESGQATRPGDVNFSCTFYAPTEPTR